MITVIHGDDTASSRTYFKSLIKNNRTLDGELVNIMEITETLASEGLFQEEKTLGIENFFSKRKPSKETTKMLDTIKTYESTNTIVFWESKPLTKKLDTVLPKATVKAFTYPKSLFQFLDSLSPKSTKLLPLFHETRKHTEEELIFFMLIRQFRLLLALTTDSEIDETRKIAPWQRQKLQNQARKFSQEELLKAYKNLYTIDLSLKTGQIPASLTEQIDFFLARL